VVAHAPGPNFKLQAVVVCNRYHYFLRCMPPQSKFHFDKMGGTLEDRVTQRVCESIAWSLPTDALRSRWKQFRKAHTDAGLARLSMRDWMPRLDAGVVAYKSR